MMYIRVLQVEIAIITLTFIVLPSLVFVIPPGGAWQRKR